MKTLKSFIKESINDMLTFKGGILSQPGDHVDVIDEDKVKALETIACKQLFPNLTSDSLSYEYHYESSEYPEGVIVSCNSSHKKYLVSYHGHIIDLDFSR